MRSTIMLLVLAIACGWCDRAAHGQDDAGDAQNLRVATTVTPPFVSQDEDGELSGIDVELWNRVADRLGVQTSWQVVTLPEVLEAVQNGRADVGIAALTISRERESVMDFSHAYFNTGLGIAVSGETGSALGVLSLLKGLFSLAFLQAVGALALVLLISGVLMWFFERRTNTEQFGLGVRGLGDGFWWSAVTMTTVGYGDKAPVTVAGRFVALVWMFASIIIIAAFTGSIASAITVGALDGKVRGPEDLPDVRVAAPDGTTAESYLRDAGVRPREATSVEEALDMLERGEVDAVVHDAPVLRSLAQGRPDVRVLEATFEPQNYGMALPEGSTLREEINRAILAETDGRAWRDLIERYLGP